MLRHMDFIELRTCRPGTFQCISGHCIPEALKCNGYADCLDFSDESTCREYAELEIYGPLSLLIPYTGNVEMVLYFLFSQQQLDILEDAGVHHTSSSVTTSCVWTSNGCVTASTTVETAQMSNSPSAVRHYRKLELFYFLQIT